MNISSAFYDFRNRNVQISRWRLSIDPLLPLVLLLLAWALSSRYYPEMLYLSAAWKYWMLGGLTAVFITVSILIHELGHSSVARALNIPIERIHLYLFGGMAELQHRPHAARQEFWIALAGPMASLGVALFSWVMYALVLDPTFMAWYFFRFLALINLLIALFNLLPIFPLDGGRLLRSVIWAVNGNYLRASWLTKRAGSFIAGLLLLLALADYTWLQSDYVIFSGILALYMMYTWYSGRYELNYMPSAGDLIRPAPEAETTQALVEQLMPPREQLLKRCIFPVLEHGEPYERLIIEGKVLNSAADDISQLPAKPAVTGDFIDLDEPNSWSSSVVYNAEWIPVYHSGRVVGMCDAKELRFWLQQNENAIHLWLPRTGKGIT
ncbi:Zn-dependent protease (includes SpoIVFB) [Cyclonatronum proteinivorum]|uniref:Zn-dependent protease (Includes SpoIVFB) n=1 Tax=Cyclonatronum proteinivorum TaxID=1457365 RepID=A0A345UJI4_9BACT|nr:site-2 protease family protein [Cyclonatronum proteinivorum]AXJ00636.1 Zn-dependent protease (includes SpoIVFB) [Cyclonatronum proteinivorum]